MARRFKPGDRWQEFVTFANERGKALGPDGVGPDGLCDGARWGRAQGDITVAEGIRRMASYGFHGDPPGRARWAEWLVFNTRDALAQRLISILVDGIAAHSPTAAARVYGFVGELRDRDDRVLWRAFQKTYPAIVKEFRSGRYKRAKGDVGPHKRV